MRSSNNSLRIFFALFLASGFSGLIYESIWSHYLKLFLGHAAYAQTLVLAIFMGGMAVGSWWIAARSASLRNLLIGYAIVEGVIGLLGLSFHPLSKGLTDWAFASAIPALGEPWSIQLFKWTLASFLILPQSVLLGMTFPLMSGAIVRRFPEKSGETLAMLYFTNSFGAAVGVLISGFVLVGAVGLPGTIMTAGLLNIALALIVWGISKHAAAEPPALQMPASPVRPRRMTSTLKRLLLIGALATGAAAFMYEIAWIRMLSLVLGSSSHAFELMLSAFILGIALGGLWVRKRIQNLHDPLSYLGWVMTLMACVALGSIQLYDRSFDWMAAIMATVTPTDFGYVGFNIGSHAIAIGLMAPTTFFCGLTLPIMTNVLLREDAGESAIGSVYAWNTVGAIIGILLAVHVLMPTLGVKAVIIGGAIVHGALGLTFLLTSGTGLRLQEAGALLAMSVALFAAVFLLKFDPLRMGSGVYRHGSAASPIDAESLYFRHGKTASISLVRSGGVVTIATNGKPDAAISMNSPSAAPDEITMVLAGALPMAMHRKAQTVANIGIGSGLTTHVLLLDPDLKSVDTIEIEPLMVDAARLGFMPHVRNTFEDPRSHIHIEDAKTFFATRQGRYDIIISEPSNPWVRGVASLFSTEFYRQIKSYMQPDGLMVQWLQIYETDLQTVVSILKALASEFPDFALYRTDDANVLIVAVQQGSVPDIDPHKLFAGNRDSALARVGLTTTRDATSRYVGNRSILMPAISVQGSPANSDYFPFVDQSAIRARFLKSNALDVSQLSAKSVPMIDLLLGKRAPLDELGEVVIDPTHLDELATAAREMHDAVTLGPDTVLSNGVARQLALLRMSAADCGVSAMRKAWIDATFTLVQTITPTLSDANIREVWAALDKAPCVSALGADDRLFLALMRSISLRESTDIVQQGVPLLESPYVFGDLSQFAYASMATAAAAIGEGKHDVAARVLKILGDDAAATDSVALWDRAILAGLALQSQ